MTLPSMPCFDFLKGLAARYTLILVALGLCVNLLFFDSILN